MITLKEATRKEFEEFLKQYLLYKNLNNMLALQFSDYPFDFQSGVFTAYLRSVNIEVTVNKSFFTKEYYGFIFTDKEPGYSRKNHTRDYNEALIAAINAGLELREQQLLTNIQSK